MAMNEPFRFDPEDFDRVVRGAGNQLRGAFGKIFEGPGQRAGWTSVFEDAARRSGRKPEPETAGETGEGVWAVYTVDGAGGARVEQVYASELDALRANKHNTDSSRKVRFLPYGIAVSVLDGPEESSAN